MTKSGADKAVQPSIVTDREMLSAPLLNSAQADQPKPEAPAPAEPKPSRAALKPNLKPPESAPAKPVVDLKVPEPKPEPQLQTRPETPDQTDKDPKEKAKPDPKVEAEAEAQAQAEHEAGIKKLVDNKQYFLPINSVEKRRSKRFVAVGILLSLLLVAAWADIALDAGLIELQNIKPVTHFFSS